MEGAGCANNGKAEGRKETVASEGSWSGDIKRGGSRRRGKGERRKVGSRDLT